MFLHTWNIFPPLCVFCTLGLAINNSYEPRQASNWARNVTISPANGENSTHISKQRPLNSCAKMHWPTTETQKTDTVELSTRKKTLLLLLNYTTECIFLLVLFGKTISCPRFWKSSGRAARALQRVWFVYISLVNHTREVGFQDGDGF